MFSWSPSANSSHRVAFYYENSNTLHFDVLHKGKWHEVTVKSVEEVPTDVKELYQVMREAYQDFICCASLDLVES
jgi:uncharacterized protein YoxC